MVLVGAAIIGFLVGLILCYWKQLKTAYDNRDTIGAVTDITTGASSVATGAQTLWQKL